MQITECIPCQHGRHEECGAGMSSPPPGMIGGTRCGCEGECVERARTKETPQDRGRAFEAEQAAETGLEQIARSGAGNYKLDLGAGSEIRASLKHTDAASLRIDEKMLQELDDATSGPGGVGADKTGVLVTRIGALDRVVATLDWQDLIRLLKQSTGSIPLTKDERRRAEAAVPSYLRE